MKNYTRQRLGLCAALGVFAATCGVFAQTAAPSGAAPSDDSVLTLDKFTVTAEKSTGYRATTAITATGIGTKIGDTPLAISVLTSEFISDRGLNSLQEALNSVPGVLTNPRSESTFVVRGFGGNITYRNGQYRRQTLTDWNIDQVEVIMGPSAIFFGAVRPGGIVNYITKKPVFTGDFTDVKVTMNDAALYRGEVFHNQVINDKLAMRIGVGHIEDHNSDYDFFFKHETYLGGSLIWKPTANQQITLDLERLTRRQFYVNVYGGRLLTNSHYFGDPTAIAAKNTSKSASSDMKAWLKSKGYSDSIGIYDMFAPAYGSHGAGYGYALAKDAHNERESRTVDLDYLLKISDSLVFQSTLNAALDDATGLQTSDDDKRVYADGTMRVRYEDFEDKRISQVMKNKLTYRFNLGPTKHTLQLGQDFQRVKYTRPGYFLASNNTYNSSPGIASTSSSPYYFFKPADGPISLEAMRAASTERPNMQRDTRTTNYGLFIVDQMSAFDERLFVMAGARDNRFTENYTYSRPISNVSNLATKDSNGLATYDPTAGKGMVTPQVGVLAKFLPGLAAYSTWSTSIEPVFAVDSDGVSSEPVESESFDFGVKADFFDGRLTATAAYYNIERGNLAYWDPNRSINGKTYYLFGNTEESKGGELNINYSPVDNYQLVLGWGHLIDAKTTKAEGNASLVGRRFGYTPENTLSIWNRYTVKSGAAKGVVLGLGARYSEGAMASQSLDTAIYIPGFTVYDAMASYKFKVGGRDYTAKLNIKNLTNTFYRDNADGYIGEARRIFLSVATRF